MQTYFVLQDQIVLEPLESQVVNLLERNNEVWLNLALTLMAFSWESEYSLSTHTRLDVNGFSSNSHSLSLSITLKLYSLKTNIFFAPVIEFIQSASDCNC